MKYANNIFFLKKYFTKKRAKNQKLVKTIVFKKLLTFSMIIYYLLFPTNLLIKKKIGRKDV